MRLRTLVVLLLLLSFSLALALPSVQNLDENKIDSVKINLQDEENENKNRTQNKAGMKIEDMEMNDSYNVYGGIIGEEHKWPDAELVYSYDRSFRKLGRKYRKKVEEAMEMISEDTCITFRARKKNDVNYVHIRSIGEGCRSSVGMRGGNQMMSLDPSCFEDGPGSAAHELMHALGFHHEHCRSDRDRYIQVNWNNIEAGKRFNFEKYNAADVSDYGIKYDYYSIMHYANTAGGKEGKDGKQLETLTVLKPGVQQILIGQMRALSSKDIAKVNKLYNCDIDE